MTKRKVGQEDRDTKRTHCINFITTCTLSHSLSDIYDVTDPCRFPFDQAITAIDKTEYKDAIDTATFGLDDLIKKQIALLDVRAKAFGLVNDFDNGIKDAMQMIQLMPSIALGYLRCGDLYSVRCNHKQAYSIYKQGYHATDKANPDRALLKERYEREQSQLDRRVDFITQLPFDLLPIVMERFAPRDLLKLLDVSRRWRYRLSEECASLWSTVMIDNGCSSKWQWKRQEFSRITHVAQHIIQLHLSEVMDVRSMEEIFIPMANNKFTRLQELIIHGCVFRIEGKIQHALEQVKETLTKLAIHDLREPHRFSYLPFKAILSTCQNLKTFCYQHYILPHPIYTDSFQKGKLSSITTLVLEVKFISEMDVDAILEFCPKLRTLALGRCPFQVIRYAIPRYCHALEKLTLNAPEKSEEEDKKEGEDRQQYGLKDDRDWKPGDGIRYINVGHVDRVDQLVPILTACTHSLEWLSIQFNFSTSLNGAHRFIGVLQQMNPLNKLEKLTVMNCGGIKNNEIVTRLLQKSPHLTHVFFKECDLFERGSNGPFQAIKQLNHLQDLYFREIAYADTHAMMDMFQHLISKGTSAKLQRITFYNCPFLSDTLLVAISHLLTLVDISIYTLYDAEITTDGFLRFCDNLRQHSSLKRLSLRCTDCASSQAIRYLQEIASLRELCLDGTSSFTRDDLIDFSGHVNIDF
ncbi:hypothetical protein BDA99DRAFT_558968 [Phascolomyces articulosus]|uniref:F-box domain-containing protein n=1 Tax=Phascolomyces articulosus TaxID=60185 RepID=A0AAD5K1Q6_9FUNG|nr:hypothetical protein BDA99DRAFT_558968 [Phascolomyces articulosus]